MSHQKYYSVDLFSVDFNNIYPTIPESNDPVKTPIFERSIKVSSENANPAMNKDIVKPIPASIPAA